MCIPAHCFKMAEWNRGMIHSERNSILTDPDSNLILEPEFIFENKGVIEFPAAGYSTMRPWVSNSSDAGDTYLFFLRIFWSALESTCFDTTTTSSSQCPLMSPSPFILGFQEELSFFSTTKGQLILYLTRVMTNHGPLEGSLNTLKIITWKKDLNSLFKDQLFDLVF